MLPALFLLLTLTAQSPPVDVPSTQPKRMAYEGVVALEGKTIGTTILLDLTPTSATEATVGGWIQRNDFFPIDSGRMNAEQIAFTSGGNQYSINLRTNRINYTGPDGSGNQRVEKMTPVLGQFYRLTEPAMTDATVTIVTDQGEKEYLIGSPSIWKRAGPPIDRFDSEKLKEVLGKTVTAWLARIGGTRYLAVLEEPEGMDLQKKTPKKKDKDKKKK